jgi:hypothetical protein
MTALQIGTPNYNKHGKRILQLNGGIQLSFKVLMQSGKYMKIYMNRATSKPQWVTTYFRVKGKVLKISSASSKHAECTVDIMHTVVVVVVLFILLVWYLVPYHYQ